MTLTIELSVAVERQLAERAAKTGQSAAALASELIERAVAPEKSFDEILAPFRQSFAESGMTDDELDALIEEAREDVWQEQQCPRPILVCSPEGAAS